MQFTYAPDLAYSSINRISEIKSIELLVSVSTRITTLTLPTYQPPRFGGLERNV